MVKIGWVDVKITKWRTNVFENVLLRTNVFLKCSFLIEFVHDILNLFHHEEEF